MNELDTSKPIKMYHIINAICNIKSNSFQNPLTSPFSRKTKNNFSIKYDKMAKIWQLRHIENRIGKNLQMQQTWWWRRWTSWSPNNTSPSWRSFIHRLIQIKTFFREIFDKKAWIKWYFFSTLLSHPLSR